MGIWVVPVSCVTAHIRLVDFAFVVFVTHLVGLVGMVL
jgi:hypothetical protein